MSLHELQQDLPIAICLMGPTATGKTDLAISLVKSLPLEIISVDSAQIYLGMDVGSGKPSSAVREQVPHHLMDFLDPKIAYSAAQFCNDALDCMVDITKRGKTPLLVGGTMLYFKALQQGLSPLPQADERIRKELTRRIKDEGLATLYQQLQSIDPITAQRLQPTDPQRIMRALEVYEITAQPLSFWISKDPEQQIPYRFLNLGLLPLTTVRQVLHDRITMRFENMLAQGLVEEVKTLLQRDDLSPDCSALRAVGYRQVVRFLQGEETYDQMCLNAIAATRQLAKRQMTWLRHWPAITPLDFLDPQLLGKIQEIIRMNNSK